MEKYQTLLFHRRSIFPSLRSPAGPPLIFQHGLAHQCPQETIMFHFLPPFHLLVFGLSSLAPSFFLPHPTLPPYFVLNSKSSTSGHLLLFSNQASTPLFLLGGLAMPSPYTACGGHLTSLQRTSMPTPS